MFVLLYHLICSSTGVDSFYEYLIKAHILFGKDEFWMMFQSAYLGVQKYFRHGPWYFDQFLFTTNILNVTAYARHEYYFRHLMEK